MRLFTAALITSLLFGCDVRAKDAARLAAGADHSLVNFKAGRCYAGAGSERFRRYSDNEADYSLSGPARVRLARSNKLAVVKSLLADAGLSWPPRRVFLRAFKQERALELWASNSRRGPMTHVATYQICFASGAPGPKRREGDGQVPEGFYKLDLYNQRSSYFLSMRVNYPNQRDRLLGHTGSAIMIHGACVSIGCLAMSDDRIQELWLLTREAHRQGDPVQVHLFPGCDLAGMIRATNQPRLKTFWRSLKRGHDLFQENHEIPRIGVNRQGEYTFPE